MREFEKRHDQAASRLATDIEGALISKHGGIVAYILAQARAHADAAREALTQADPTDSETIRTLQNEVHRHRELKTWLQAAIDEGEEAWRRLTEEEKQEVINELEFPNAA